jgi:hypothetical protein
MVNDLILVRSTHPYLDEILQISYPQHMLQRTRPRPPKAFEDTPFTWVATPEDLEHLLQKLRHVSEIAVDLEHHSYRSYYGFLCLMQISTREEDFIIDTLALREDLEDLDEIFVDPKVVKVRYFYLHLNVLLIPLQVFHGADSDIVWLQESLNLYVVNLFDTYRASKVLGKALCYCHQTLLIHAHQDSQNIRWLHSSPSTAILRPISDTNAPTGEYDHYQKRCFSMLVQILTSFFTFMIDYENHSSTVDRARKT